MKTFETEKCKMKEQPFYQCCCNCKQHLKDFKHCTVEGQKGKGCVCGEQKGWICAGFGHEGVFVSGWPEHSIGCELYDEIRQGAEE